ncbi:MAG: hypothetical protein HY874_01525 [Chloroflexi bacterium]|nr:hypothetical protein [Chloroflexota bacterium]
MLILDKDRTLDRMIWLSGRHSVVVPEQFSYDHAPAVADAASVAADPAWRWSDALAPSAPPSPLAARPATLPAAA